MDAVQELEVILNGDPFCENAGGEKQSDIARHSFYIGSDMLGVIEGPAVYFTEFPVRNDSEKNAPLVFKPNQTAQFITDQMLYLRVNCKIDDNEVSNEQLFEIALIRYLAYKHRLVCANQRPDLIYVRYSEVSIFPTEGPESVGALLGVSDKGQMLAALCRQRLNTDRAKIAWTVSVFSDLICTIAYLFRSRGHHYLDGFGQIYENLWAKIESTQERFKSTWAMLATDALHVIFPCVLDHYWNLMRMRSQISPSLVLGWTVPAAGTAAIFAVGVGWDDAKTVYGVILAQRAELEKHLDELLIKCQAGRWHHSINAKYYGAPSDRLDLSRLKPLCATVYGVYQTGAPEASLLLSPALKQEALSASRMIRDMFVKSVKDEQRKGGRVPAVGN